MENLKDALEYVVDLKDNEEKIVRSYEGQGILRCKSARLTRIGSAPLSGTIGTFITHKPG